MKNNWVREKLLAGEPVLGLQMGLGSPAVAEMMGYAGYDWLVIETEHNALDFSQIEHMMMAMSSTDVVPLVRPSSGDPLVIQKVLDAGAMGLFVPMIRTAADETVVGLQRIEEVEDDIVLEEDGDNTVSAEAGDTAAADNDDKPTTEE